MLCLQWDCPSPERLLWGSTPGVCRPHTRSKFSLNPGHTQYHFFPALGEHLQAGSLQQQVCGHVMTEGRRSGIHPEGKHGSSENAVK
ncbi:hypothetical protein Nmel_007625 [Mimus melanotis]